MSQPAAAAAAAAATRAAAPPATPASAHRPDSPRAWLIVLGSFMAQFATIGNLYAFGVYVPAFTADFGVDEAEVSLIGTVSLACFFLGGSVAATLADQLGVRRVLGAGALVWIAGMFLATAATQYWHLVLTLGVMTGLGGAFVYWPAVTVLPQWFVKYRGTATSFASLGSGLGNLAFALGGANLIANQSWRFMHFVFGGVGAATLLVAFALVERRLPRVTRRGTLAFNVKMIRTRPDYACFLLGAFTFQFAFFVPFAEITTFALDAGFTPDVASLCVAFLGIGSSVGRVVFGPVSDMIGRTRMFRAAVFAAALCMFLWPTASTPGQLYAFSFMYAFFGGGFIAMVPAVAADQWGLAHLGYMFSGLTLVMVPGGLTAGVIAGAWYDAKSPHTFFPAIMFAGSMLLIAFCFMLAVGANKERTPNPTGGAGADAKAPTATSSSGKPEAVRTSDADLNRGGERGEERDSETDETADPEQAVRVDGADAGEDVEAGLPRERREIEAAASFAALRGDGRGRGGGGGDGDDDDVASRVAEV